MKILKNKILLITIVALSFTQLLAQQIYTPDKEITLKLNSGELDPTNFFNITEDNDGLIVAPIIPDSWTWFIVKELKVGNAILNFFFYEGRIYTDKSVKTNHRRIKYQKNISELIESNVFNMSFYKDAGKEKYAAILLFSEKETTAEIEIPQELWGIPKTLTYQLEAGEAKLISIQKLPDESYPYYFENLSAKRDSVSLNSNWKFIKQDQNNPTAIVFDDSTWENISIPHCWNSEDMFDTRNINDGLSVNPRYYRGVAWYRKYLTVDESFSNKKLFLDFEAALQTADVWVNDKFIGNHIGGYTGFKFEITDLVKFGEENIITVKVDNSYNYNIPPHSADYIMYGGIYRDVRLIAVNPLMITDDIKITTPFVSHDSASVNVKLNIKNNYNNAKYFQVVSNIVNNNDEIISTKVVESSIFGNGILSLEINHFEIRSPELWSPSSPYLYKIITTIFQDGKAIDEVQLPLGFRWFSFDSNKGFFLNGKYLFLKGANKHQDYYKLGIAVPDSMQVKDIKLLKDMGSNFIRLAHYPQDPSVLKACDELGLLVWEEIPIVNSIGGKEFAENAKNMIREMIHRDFNHPSVIMWGVTNESLMGFATEEAAAKVYNLIEELNSLVKELDPTRVSVSVHNHMKDVSIADITDVIGRNRYYGWYDMPITLFKDELDREHREHPNWVTIISEYGVGSKLGYHVENPERFDFSEEYQALYHEYYLKTINESPWIAGALIWAGIDFASFTKNGNIAKVNQKGVFDFNRKPKDVYYFYKSQWTDVHMVYIVSHTQKRRTGLLGEKKKVKVYSNGDSVELFLNGKSVGKLTDQYVFNWEVQFVAGENILKAISEKDDETITDEIKLEYKIKKNGN